MSAKLLTDYHFHPNLSKSDYRAYRKARMLWQRFAEKQVDVVVITEHVFKNPERAYRIMEETRPDDATTIIFPGIEGLTAEGVDFIIFTKDTSIYEHQKLMVPKQLDVFGMITYVQKYDHLFASIAHPFSPGHSGLVNHIGLEAGKRAVNELGAMEISNPCFRGLIRVMDVTRFSLIKKRQRKWMDMTRQVPEDFFDASKIQLYTGGSDAHVIVEIGSGLLVPHDGELTHDNIFNTITHNTSTEFQETDEPIYFWLGLYKSYSVAIESLTKAFRLYEGRLYQQDDKFTNFYSEAEKEAVLALRKKRVEILKPMLNFLTYFHVTPRLLNIIAMASVVSGFVLLYSHVLLGSALFVIYLSCTSITGALARYQDTESEAGAIMKIAVHYVALLTPILTTIWNEWGDPFWAALYLGVYTIMLWQIITLNQIGQPIRLVIRSKYFIIGAIFLYAITDINIITELLIGFSVYMVIMNAWMLFRLRAALQQQS